MNPRETPKEHTWSLWNPQNDPTNEAQGNLRNTKETYGTLKNPKEP